MIKKIYVDFDDTIVNSKNRIIQMYNNKYHTNVSEDYIKTWNFTELPKLNKNKLLKWFEKKRFFNKQLNMFNDVYETLFILSKYFDIVIVSIGTKKNLKYKEKWIKKNLPFVKYILIDFGLYNNKSHIDMSDGIFIDDNYNYLSNTNAKYKINFGKIKTQYNSNNRCRNWIEVFNYIKSVVK